VSTPAGAGADSTAALARRPLLWVRDLNVRFMAGHRIVHAVDGFTFQVRRAHTLAIVGESGSGKTVACRALLGLLPKTALVGGTAHLDGVDLLTLPERSLRKVRGADIAMVFQDPLRSLDPSMRIGEQIIETILQHHALTRHAARQRAIELLQRLCVPAAHRRLLDYPHELSGGLRQRVMIAIAIAGDPRILVADEATRSLDPITQEETLVLFKELQAQLGMSILLISHDLRTAARVADDVLVVRGGATVECGPVREVFSHPRMRYTQSLLEAIPPMECQP
jgi:ABC-type dipeptide/oligopeptide/nickel transport system ATPase component